MQPNAFLTGISRHTAAARTADRGVASRRTSAVVPRHTRARNRCGVKRSVRLADGRDVPVVTTTARNIPSHTNRDDLDNFASGGFGRERGRDELGGGDGGDVGGCGGLGFFGCGWRCYWCCYRETLAGELREGLPLGILADVACAGVVGGLAGVVGPVFLGLLLRLTVVLRLRCRAGS